MIKLPSILDPKNARHVNANARETEAYEFS